VSQENVEIVRRVYEARARGDSEAVLALYDPEIEFSFTPGTFMDRMGNRLVFRGHEGLRAFDRELRDEFETLETICEELIDAGEQVISLSRYRGRGRRSGVDIASPIQLCVWTLRRGKIVRSVWFENRAEALEAAGLKD
jgi:ketosteroid isomerase-like protein